MGLFTWQYAESFRASSVIASGIAPWFVYPMLLGVVGLLAIVSIRFLYESPGDGASRLKVRNSYTILFLFIIILFVIGRIITYVNTSYTHTGYWEKRFVAFIFLMVALIAPVPLIVFYETIKKKLNEHIAKVFTVLLVSIITILGFSSFAVQVEHWGLAGTAGNAMSDNEIAAISFLRDRLANEKDSFVVTPTKQSAEILSIAGPKYRFSSSDLLSSSKEPAVPMQIMGTYNSNRTYLYMHDRDYNVLVQNPESWFSSHLLSSLRPIYANSEVSIYEIPHLSFPQSSSDNVLLTPSDERNRRWLYAYDILAFTGGNYTARVDNGDDFHRNNSKVLSYDPNSVLRLDQSFSSDRPMSLVGSKQMSGNWTLQRDGLHTGYDGVHLTSVPSMMLSPLRHVQGDSFNISTAVAIDEANPATPSYVRLIYSWKDTLNYRFVETMFVRNELYLNSGVVDGGKVTAASKWPGIRVASNWTQGDVLDLSMSVNDNILRMNLNGTNLVYDVNQEPESGYIGFYSIRGKHIIFRDFYAEIRPTETNISRFIDYVKSGGYLTVINSDGRGSLYDFVVDRDDRDEMEVNESNDSKSVIKAYSANVGRGKIQYIDIFQTINEIESGQLSIASLHDIAKYLHLDRTQGTDSSFGRVKAVFDDVYANGRIYVTSQSIILPEKAQNIKVEFNNGSQALMNNVSDLILRHLGKVRLGTEGMMINDGTGLYASIKISGDESARISFDNIANVSLKVDQKDVNLQDVSAISIITNEPIDLLNPSLSIDGSATFKSVSSGQLRVEMGIQGQDLIVDGKSSFDVFMADANIMAERIAVEGRKTVDPPVISFDEFKPIDRPLSLSALYSVPQVVRGLLTLPVAIAILLMIIPQTRDRSYWKPESTN
jgi:hypothetical protein